MTKHGLTCRRPSPKKVFISAPEHGRRTLLVQVAQAEGIPRVLPNSGGVILIGDKATIERVLQQAGALAVRYEAARLRALVGVIKECDLPVPQEIGEALGVAEQSAKSGSAENFQVEHMQYLSATV